MNQPSNPTTQRHRVPFLLPVRTKLAPLTALKAWLQTLWQRWRRPRLRVQPPLQPGRHKPFPNRPHQQRRQAVFAALDAAPVGLTRRQLIAHVRAVTGVGCSEKLITHWRTERGKSTANSPPRKVIRQQRSVQLRLFLLCVFVGVTTKPWFPVASVAAQEITIAPAPAASPNPTIAPAPRLLRIKLTLHDPTELRVEIGDEVKAGDILSDQRQARHRLLLQKRTLERVLRHLQTQTQLTAQSLQQLQSLGLDLPPTTFAAEQTAIRQAEMEVLTAQRALATQQERLSVVRGQLSVAFPAEGTIPTDEEPLKQQNQRTTDNGRLTLDKLRAIQEHEEAKLKQAQDKQQRAQADLEGQHAKLLAARAVRAVAEQQHRVDSTRQQLSVQNQQQQAAIERARLTAQRAELDLQLAQLTAVRAPFAGTIKRIEWEDMNDEKLTVVVYLSVSRR